MGQGPEEPSALNVTNGDTPCAQHLIVDTGASHVLFRQKDSQVLSNVQMSVAGAKPYAVLKAANGALLNSIGRGMLTIGTVTVTAYIFQDKDLVHNLLGIAPFADCGCTATFTAKNFWMYHGGNDPIMTGERHAHNLWRIAMPQRVDACVLSISDEPSQVLLMHQSAQQPIAEHIRFVHACLGSPPPNTFLRAVSRGYITGPRQFPRLTSKLVRRYMPNSEATARGHLRKSPTAQPHAASQAVSALRRHHKIQLIQEVWKKHLQDPKFKARVPFDPTSAVKSTTLHLDYTGLLPERCSEGTVCFMISCWGCYIHVLPLTSMKGASTAAALTTAVEFFRSKGITLDNIRMDNQSSPEFKTAAANLGLTPNLVASMQKEGNRSERAIQTAKNHIISIRAGFHRDCPTSYLDKCVAQIEMTMNVMHPYEYDPQLSAYDGIFKHPFDFMTHPIAPLGSKVLTWDSPEKRGSWADHGTSGIYVGPAMDHFRAFRIWVPETSAMRTSATVWWFFPSFHPDDNLTTLQNIEVSYPPTRERHNPQRNGSDLLGRYFFDPDIGVCCITRLGPVTQKQLPSRAQLRSQAAPDLTIVVGTH